MKMYKRKKESEFLTEEEARLLCSLPDQRTIEGKRDMAILMLMLTTGLRKAEVCSLKIGSIGDYRNQKVLDIVGKGKRYRRVALKPEVVELISKYHKSIGNGTNPEEPMFKTLGKYGPFESRALTHCAVDCIVKKYAQMSCLKKRVTPHTLRHTFATTLLSKGVDLRTTQELMGHSSIQTTELYLHSNDDKKFEAIWKLNF